MNKTMTTILAMAGLASLLVIGACHKSEYRSTSTYNATNDDNPARQRPTDKSIADDDWDFVAPQGKMVVDPD